MELLKIYGGYFARASMSILQPKPEDRIWWIKDPPVPPLLDCLLPPCNPNRPYHHPALFPCSRFLVHSITGWHQCSLHGECHKWASTALHKITVFCPWHFQLQRQGASLGWAAIIWKLSWEPLGQNSLTIAMYLMFSSCHSQYDSLLASSCVRIFTETDQEMWHSSNFEIFLFEHLSLSYTVYFFWGCWSWRVYAKEHGWWEEGGAWCSVSHEITFSSVTLLHTLPMAILLVHWDPNGLGATTYDF